MADNKIANAIKFLKGEEKSLPATKTEGQVYFAYKNVGTAEKPSYTGAIYIDTPIGGAQNRIKMTANADIADKAFNDSAGKDIRGTYLSSLGYTDDGKQTILIKGSGNSQTKIALPIASTTKSGIITTDAQSFGGTKTFVTINSTNLTVTGSDGFNYSGIGAGTANAVRPVWFADNSGNGKPVINANFTYNPATQTLSVTNLSGTADKAIKDDGGQNIRNTYISNVEVDKNNKYKYNFKTPTGAIKNSITVYDEFQKRSQIDATTDWNTLISTGIYKVQMSAWGDATKMHSPNSYNKNLYSFGILLVFESIANDSEKRFTQIYIPHNEGVNVSGSAYKRMHNGNDITTGWQSWHPIARGLNWNELTNKPNYAGSSSAGGAANYALKLQTYKQGSTTETYGVQYPLYAQWQDNTTVKLKCDGYKTLIDRAILLNPIYTSNTLTTGTSTWCDGVTEGKVVWGQNWVDTSLSNDSADISLWLNKAGNSTTINMTLDGIVRAVSGFNGDLIKTTPQLCAANEHNEITIKVNNNGIFQNSIGVSSNASLRNGLDFKWYDTNWQIGNIRGSSVDSAGFGFAFKADKNSTLALKARIDTNGVYHGGVDKLATARKIILAGLGQGSVLFDGSGDVTITDVGYGCTKYVTTNATTEPYYRIAYYSNNKSWVDASIVFSIDSGYIGGGFGIVKVAFRSNNVTADAQPSDCEVSWLVRQGFNANQIFVKGNAPAGGNQYADLYFKATGQYQAVTIRVLSSGERGSISRNWTFEEGASRKNADIRTYSYTVEASDVGIVKNSIKWNDYENDIGTNNTSDTWLLVANNNKIQHKLTTSFATSGHTHNYAGSASVGGSANSAVKLDSSAGSSTQPVYFSGGKPVACTYTLNKSVPADAKFTDTNTWRPLGTTGDTACAGNDSRLSNARPASDVYAWAKASTKPSYSWGEITGKPSTFTPSSHTHRDLDTIGSVGYYGSDIANSNGWYKVYSTTLTGYNDHVARLSIVSGYNPYASGLLILHLRCNNTTSLAVQRLIWETRQGFNVDDVIISTNGNTWTLYLKITNTQYGRIKIRVLESMSTVSNWIMLLSDNNTKESINPKATATAKDGATVNYANSAGSISWNGVTGKPSTFTPSYHTHDDRYYTETEINNKLANYLPVTGGTLSGALTAPNITASNYFTTPSMAGEGDLSTYYHRVDFGHSGVNQFDFYEYGGIYNFYQNQSTGKDKAVLLGRITLNGWEGNVTGNLSGNATTATALTTSAGTSTQPIYFSGGKPIICTYTLSKSVPADAKFTDTWRPLGTTADTACAGNDSRLSNARPASDVYAWAKASSKPVYTKAEIGLGNVDNTADSQKSVKYATTAGSATTATTATMTTKLQTYKQGNTTETYGTQYSLYAQWEDSSNLRLKVDNYTVKVNYADKAGTAGACTGNAATATKLQTARTISLTGSVTGSGTFDGSGNLSITTSTNHSHSQYLPLAGGTMTGTINFNKDMLACNFKGSDPIYDIGIMHQTSGNEALVFAAADIATSFIFKCGQKPTTMTSSTWTNITPSMQIKNQSVYINSLIANGVTPSYNLYVNGPTRCNGDLAVGEGNGSSAIISFFSSNSTTSDAKIDVYKDRIEFSFN